MSSTKITLNTLSRKHAVLQTELVEAQANVKSIHEKLNVLEGSILLIDPDYKLTEIKPKPKYCEPKFERGEVPRLTGDFVRDTAGNFTSTEIIEAIIKHKGEEIFGAAREKLGLCVYNALKRLEKNKVIRCVGTVKESGATMLWRKTH